MNKALIYARETAGLKQTELAKLANVTPRNYQRYEADKQEPRARTAVKIAKALNTTVEQLFSVADDSTTPLPQ